MRARVMVGLLGGVVVLLTGCTAGDVTHTPAPTASTGASEATPILVPTGTIGSGTFTSDNGSTGAVRFDFDGELLTLILDDLVLPTETQVATMVAVQPIPDEQTCYDSGMRMAFGPAGAGTTALDGQDLDFFMGDPSGIDQVILTTVIDVTGDPDCLATVVARADIEWTFEPLLADLQPTDSGPTGGARGVVETVAGASVAYTVAPGDLIEEVAARLGITVDQIFYFNTDRSPAPQQHTLRDGERLNLLVDKR